MSDLSQLISELMQHSIESNASFVELYIVEDKKNNKYTIEISDNGTIENRETCPAKTCLAEMAEKTGGSIEEGTDQSKFKYKATLGYNHADRSKLGDIATVWTSVIKQNPEVRLLYVHDTFLGTFDIDTKDIKSDLEGLAINNPSILKEIKELIKENLEMIEAEL